MKKGNKIYAQKSFALDEKVKEEEDVMLMSRMITEMDVEHSLREMVEVSEEKDFRIEMLEVIMGKEVLEVIEVEIKVNGMEEIQTTREIIMEEEMGGLEE